MRAALRGLRIGRVLAVAALCAAVLSAACIGTFQGAWSLETKRNLMRSLTFESTELFQRDGRLAFELPATARLDRARLERIQRKLQRIMDDVARRHGARYPQLAEVLQVPLAATGRVRVQLVHTGRAAAYIELDGTMTLDVRVLAGLYRATLMTGTPGTGAIQRDQRVDFALLEDPRAHEVEAERHQQFLGLLATVRDTLASCLIGDAARAEIVLGSVVSGEADALAELEQVYVGLLVFLFAHELGHFALRHQPSSADEAGRDAQRARELAADRYAATLLGDAYGSRWTFGGHERSTRRMVGSFELFLRGAHRLSGLADVDPATYPTWEVRLAQATAAYDAAFTRRQREIQERERRKDRPYRPSPE